MKKLVEFVCLALTAGLSATEYFVAPNGNDSGAGTAAEPFRTIGRAAELVQAGDTVTVRSGVYHEQITIKAKGTAQKPIVFRGAPGETAIVSGGYPVTSEWKKTPGRRFIWETPAQYSVNILWDRLNMDRFLELQSLNMLDELPGAFVLDRKAKKLYVHPLQGADPKSVGIVVVPWYGSGKEYVTYAKTLTGTTPLPAEVDTTRYYRWNKGFMISGDYITLENFYVIYFPGQGIRVNEPGSYNTIRGNTVLGTTCGIMDYAATGTRILQNRLLRNAGTGIQLAQSGKQAVVEDNFLFKNGKCYQSGLEETSSQGFIYNFSQYGGLGYDGMDFRRNLVIGDPLRQGEWKETMRCKGGVRRFTEQINNVFVDGGVELYAATKSTGNVSNNTMINGIFKIHEQLATGELYKVRHEDNLIIKDDEETDPLFADEVNYDYRLRPNSPHIGKGAFPKNGGFVHIKNSDELNAALQRNDIDTIYLEPGTYTGAVKFAGKDIKLRCFEKKKVVFEKAVFTGDSGKLKFECPIFKQCTFQLNGTVEFDHCVFDASQLNMTAAFLDKCTLLASKLQAGKLTLRNTLRVGKENQTASPVLLEENNAAIAQVDEEYCLPQGSPLAYSAFDCGAIGGRPASPPRKPMVVENLQVTVLPPDRARVTCNTLNWYCNYAIVSGKGFWGRVSQGVDGVRFTGINLVLKKLESGQSYNGELVICEAGNPKSIVKKPISFRMPEKSTREAVVWQVESEDSLQEILGKARPGDTIIVAPGVYDGGFKISVNDITLKSQVPGKAVLSAAFLYSDILILDEVENITIEGFRFGNMPYNASRHSLMINNCRNITVRNSYFDRDRRPSHSGSSILFHGNGIDGLLVENCVFNQGFHGIWLMRAKNIRIDHNTFYGIGINAAHIGCEQGDKVSITNNIIFDVVGEHHSPAISVAEHGPHITCDYNLYWKTERAPRQEIYGFGRWKETHYFSGTWDVKTKNMEPTIEKASARFGVEQHGIFADPGFEDTENFRLKPGSPAAGKAKDGTDLGASVK